MMCACTRTAFDETLTHYKAEIPQLFWFNALLIASNGTDRDTGPFENGRAAQDLWIHRNQVSRVHMLEILRLCVGGKPISNHDSTANRASL